MKRLLAPCALLLLVFLSAWSAHGQESGKPGFIPEEADIHISCDPDTNRIYGNALLITIGPAMGALLLVIATAWLLWGAPYAARLLGWLSMVFGLFPAVFVLRDAAIRPTGWMDGQTIGIVVSFVTVAGGFAIVNIADRRLHALRKANFAAADSRRAERRAAGSIRGVAERTSESAPDGAPKAGIQP